MSTAVLAVAATGTAAAAALEPAGTVKRMRGQPVLLSAGGERPAAVGDTVYVGERIVTAADGALGVTLLDGTQLAVGPRSSVLVHTFRFDSTTREGSLLVDIARGAMRMVSGLIARHDARAVAVNTPTTTIGIRGTDFLVEVDGPAGEP